MKTDIDELYLKINLLESENEYLKSLLDVAGISYITSDFSDVKEEENQGNRIIPKENISYNDIKKFYEYFFCRVDIFSKRTISKTTGKIGYYLQCNKIWKFDCPKISNKKFNCKECKNPDFTVLKIPQILSHLQGKDKDGECVIGIYPLLQDDTCKLLVFDFDNHGKSGQKNDFANDNNVWKDEVNALRRICEINDVDCLVERSRSGKGAHLWIFFEEKIDAKLARRFGCALLRKGKESVNLKTFSYYDRMFPVQDQIPKGGFGNLIALPLQGLSLYKGNSAFVDRNWNAYPNQWDVLFSKKKLSKSQVEDKIKLWLSNEEKSELSLFDAEQDNTFEPWDKRNNFHKIDVNGEFQIVLADGIYIKKDNLKPRIMNQVCELASFYNPIFFSNIRNIKYNYNQSLFIYLGKDINNYIKIPRGLLEKLQTKLDEAEIGYYIKDERQIGKSISVGFNGELKDFQISAVNKMLQYDNGILQAATAFGKTVVSCNIIARRKVNTLILVHTKALLEQWEKSLKEFLIIDEEFPTYKTKTGIIKTRKSCIG